MTGQTISHYRILEKVGEGAMGVVYKAQDLRLERPVALKFLAPHLLNDAESKARFLREAKAAASLDHPNVCAVYEIGEADGKAFLTMAFIEGRTAKDKIAERPLKLDEALDIAMQAGEGLRAAHAKGIVHRDIKSANILLDAEGQVKITDFGLARLADRTRITNTASILGTPAYMSPEQARGEAADARSDIWSLGVMLYEMLTGRLPFEGERHEAVLLAILDREPEPVTACRAGLPMALERVIAKALAKNPAERYQHIEDMLVDLRSIAAKPATATATVSPRSARWTTYVPWALAAVLVVAAVLGWFSRGPAVATPVVRLTIPIPAEQDLVAGASFPLDVSADGARLLYAAAAGGATQLYLRSLDEFEARPLPGTGGAREPVFSPDGRSIAFVANGKLQKLSLTGGAPVAICDVTELVRGISWGPDDTILYGTPSGLWRVPAAGGAPGAVFEGAAAWPSYLPGGDAALVTTVGQVSVVDLDSGERRSLLPGKQGAYLPTGHLVYAAGDGIWVVRFDLASRHVTGGSTSVLNDVYEGIGYGATYFRVTSAGTLFYVPGRNEHSLVHVDRSGHITPLTDRRAGYRNPRVSPDGRRVAVTIDPPDESQSDIWILDLDRGGLTRFTTEGHQTRAVWMPNGQRLLWNRGGDVYWQPADGTGRPEALVAGPNHEFPYAITPDGKTLIYTQEPRVVGSSSDVWAVPLDRSARPYPILDSPFSEIQPRISPNGRWLAYTSDESGAEEIYVQRFPVQGRKRLISSHGGQSPVWSLDGKELFYIEGTRMMAVPVETSDEFSAGRPQLLFDRKDLTVGLTPFDATVDGFVMVQRDPLSMLTEFRVVQNWFDELKRLIPSR